MIRQTQCALLVCDSCGRLWSDEDTESPFHCPTAEQARAAAAADWHWCTDDTGRDLCPPCTCAERGHRWSGWWTPPDRPLGTPLIPLDGLRPARCCDHCNTYEIGGDPVVSGDG